MKILLAASGLFLAALPPAVPAPQGEPEAATFKVDVALLPLLVTVRGPNGEPIGDLEAGDFAIKDETLEREIILFEKRTNRPLSVVLMIDASLSTARELKFEKDSAKRFVKGLFGAGSHPRDRLAVLQFSSFVELLSGFTRSQRRLAKALNEVQPEGGTSMYDAIVLACDELLQRPGRKVMVVITDGGDTTSRLAFQRALEASHRVDAVIYGIIVVPVKSDAGRNVGGENALKSLAANTGGVTFVQRGGLHLDEAFDEILTNLRTQYLIGYYPPTDVFGTETFRRVYVSVKRPGAEVLARTGYFIPEAKPPPAPAERIDLRPKGSDQLPMGVETENEQGKREAPAP